MSGYGTSEFADTLNNFGLDGEIVITSTDTPIAVRVGTEIAKDRQMITIHPINGDIEWGFSDTLVNGSPLCEGQTLGYPAGDCLDIYIITKSTTPITVMITEAG